jgi:hypothetical protein
MTVFFLLARIVFPFFLFVPFSYLKSGNSSRVWVGDRLGWSEKKGRCRERCLLFWMGMEWELIDDE